MEKAQIIEKIKTALEEVLNNEQSVEIQENTTLFFDLHLDSTSVIELLMVLEDLVEGLSFNPETLEPDHFQTVGTLADYVMNNTAVGSHE